MVILPYYLGILETVSQRVTPWSVYFFMKKMGYYFFGLFNEIRPAKFLPTVQPSTDTE